MRDLRRDETWLADYAARKAAQREPRNERQAQQALEEPAGERWQHGIRNGGSGDGRTRPTTGLSGTQAGVQERGLHNQSIAYAQMLPAANPVSSCTDGVHRSIRCVGDPITAAADDLRRMESNPAQTTSGGVESRHADMRISHQNNGTAAVARGPLTPSTSGRTAVATSLPRSHDAGSPGPLTPIAPIVSCADAASSNGAATGAAVGMSAQGAAPIASCAEMQNPAPVPLGQRQSADQGQRLHPPQGATNQRAKADAVSINHRAHLAGMPDTTGVGHSRDGEASSPPNQRAKIDVVTASLRQPAGTVSSPPNKYRNVKTDGYDSKREAKRAAELRLLLAAGEITDLREQVKYLLLPRQLNHDGSVAERACTFIADFSYWQDGQEICEDCKGLRTEVYKIKKKLLRFMHGIVILET